MQVFLKITLYSLTGELLHNLRLRFVHQSDGDYLYNIFLISTYPS